VIRGRSDRTVKPGEIEVVEVEIATSNLNSRFERKFQVTTNDPTQPKTTLTAAGRVLVPVRLEPALASIGPVRAGDPAQTRTLTITRGDGGPIQPEILPHEYPGVTTELKELEAGQRYELAVTVSPPWSTMRKMHTLKLKTGVAEAAEMPVRVDIQVSPRLKSDPPRFTLSRIYDTPTVQVAKLVWDGPPGKVLEVSVSNPELAVTLEEYPDQQLIVLKAPPGDQTKRPVGCVVTVKTDDPAMPQLRIPVVVPKVAPTRIQPPATTPPPATSSPPVPAEPNGDTGP